MELFFHHKASPFVRKPLLVIAELAIPIEERVVDMTASTAMDEYASINPNRRFPALRDGELVIWESNAILRYLAARHGPRWLGRTPEEAARADQWLFWELAHLGPALLPLQNLRLGFTPRPEREEGALLADVERHLSVLDGELAAHLYVAGSDITIADLAIAALFSFADEADLLPAGHPHVHRWLESLRSRPSWQSTERMKRDTLDAYGVKLPVRSRLAMELDIKPLDPADAVALREASCLLEEAFGPGYPEARLAQLIQEPDRMILTARLDGQVACVGMAARLGDDLRLFASYGEEVLALLRRHRVGLLDSMAVAPGLRARGIGQRVARELMAWLVEGGCDLAAAGSWVSGGPNPSRPGLEKLGFHAIAEQPGEEHRVRNLGGRPCPVCGIPCRCSGILFVRSLTTG